MTARCDCCDFPVDMCGKEAAKQQDAEAAERRKELVNRGWFLAKWPGTCAECGTHFEPDEFIHALPGGYGRKGSKYLAECCSAVLYKGV